MRLIWIFLAALSLVAAAPPAADRSGAESVVLGPFDQIEINIVNYPDLRTTTRVNAEGAVILPLVGPVPVAGLTPANAANLIETHYVNGGFIKLPTVRLEIIDYQSRKASVLGQVNNQGLVALDRAYSVAELIAKAGGLAPDAAETAVVIRQKPGGGSDRIVVDIGQNMLSAPDAGMLTAVHAGDVVFVPKAPTFSVVGAVNRPGTFVLKNGLTVDQAIAAAGDLNIYGTRSKLRIKRAPAGGGAAAVVDVTPDDPVQPGDIIVVKERVF